jgi:hypothetical protein
MKLRLSDADRDRYGGDEWLEWDNTRLTVTEAELLQELLGVSVGVYRSTWLASGSPTVIRWALWLSLRRSGVTVPWDDFDPDLLAARYREGPPVGKGPSSTPSSPSGDGGSSSPPP